MSNLFNHVTWITPDKESFQAHIDLLEENGFSVQCSEDEKQWKKGISNKIPNILIISGIFDVQIAIKHFISAKMACREHALSVFLIINNITIEEKERLFQAGGDEVIIAPCGENELLYKIKHHTRHQKEKSDFNIQIDEASQMALLAMENSSDLGGVVNFVKEAVNSKSYSELAEQVFAATSLYSDSSLIEVKGYDQYHYFYSSGETDTDMQRFLLSQKGENRLIKTGEMIQVNHEHFVLLLDGLPVNDPAKMGRISDTLVMLSDAANRFAKGLSTEESLNKAESSRRRFLTTLSHELRTPLNGILGFSKALIGKDAEQTLGNSGLDALSRIIESTGQINAIITTLIDISSTSTGTQGLADEHIDMNALISKLRKEFTQKAEDKKLEIEFNSPTGLSMIGDYKKVVSMLSHLIDNAIKFTDQGSIDINVNTDLDQLKGQQILFSVRDTGIGIDTQDQKRVLTEVGQLNNDHNRRHYGVGLGLYYINLASQQLNGSISIDSKLNQGSTFTLSLPIGEEPQAPTPEATQTQGIDDLLF